MKYKVSELEGPLLDAAVAMAEGHKFHMDAEHGCVFWDERISSIGSPRGALSIYRPSTDWAQGGPIIGRQNIALVPSYGYDEGDPITWCASVGAHGHYIDDLLPFYGDGTGEGLTPLVAAMRAYVSAKLGDEVELP